MRARKRGRQLQMVNIDKTKHTGNFQRETRRIMAIGSDSDDIPNMMQATVMFDVLSEAVDQSVHRPQFFDGRIHGDFHCVFDYRRLPTP